MADVVPILLTSIPANHSSAFKSRRSYLHIRCSLAHKNELHKLVGLATMTQTALRFLLQPHILIFPHLLFFWSYSVWLSTLVCMIPSYPNIWALAGLQSINWMAYLGQGTQWTALCLSHLWLSRWLHWVLSPEFHLPGGRGTKRLPDFQVH